MGTVSNINGVTLKNVTSMMRNIEKTIAWYNKKYCFQINSATNKEQTEYSMLLKSWDLLKSKRELLKN